MFWQSFILSITLDITSTDITLDSDAKYVMTHFLGEYHKK